jgi:hypothetical protein
MIFEYPGEYTIITFKFGAEDPYLYYDHIIPEIREIAKKYNCKLRIGNARTFHPAKKKEDIYLGRQE